MVPLRWINTSTAIFRRCKPTSSANLEWSKHQPMRIRWGTIHHLLDKRMIVAGKIPNESGNEGQDVRAHKYSTMAYRGLFLDGLLRSCWVYGHSSDKVANGTFVKIS